LQLPLLLQDHQLLLQLWCELQKSSQLFRAFRCMLLLPGWRLCAIRGSCCLNPDMLLLLVVFLQLLRLPQPPTLYYGVFLLLQLPVMLLLLPLVLKLLITGSSSTQCCCLRRAASGPGATWAAIRSNPRSRSAQR
jgi:hypothetical protein